MKEHFSSIFAIRPGLLFPRCAQKTCLWCPGLTINTPGSSSKRTHRLSVEGDDTRGLNGYRDTHPTTDRCCCNAESARGLVRTNQTRKQADSDDGTARPPGMPQSECSTLRADAWIIVVKSQPVQYSQALRRKRFNDFYRGDIRESRPNIIEDRADRTDGSDSGKRRVTPGDPR